MRHTRVPIVLSSAGSTRCKAFTAAVCTTISTSSHQQLDQVQSCDCRHPYSSILSAVCRKAEVFMFCHVINCVTNCRSCRGSQRHRRLQSTCGSPSAEWCCACVKLRGQSTWMPNPQTMSVTAWSICLLPASMMTKAQHPSTQSCTRK